MSGTRSQATAPRDVHKITRSPKIDERPARVVILSGFQDYRSKKRASIQHITDAFRDAGSHVTFVSTRFSKLSRYTGDSRLFLAPKANRFENVNGVECFLWKTPLHPFSSSNRLLSLGMGIAYSVYARFMHADVGAALREADYIIVESGIAAIYLGYLKRMSLRAKVIYYAADKLDTVGAHPFVQRQLENHADVISHFCLRARAMSADFRGLGPPMYFADFGIDHDTFSSDAPSPFKHGTTNIVSVGSMLFDPGYFKAVAPALPDVQFHVIGSGQAFDAGPNVHLYAEMPFLETLPYLRHATAGVAPYLASESADYLAESSLKLAQFEYLRVPAICPDFAVGNAKGRFGYVPSDPTSMVNATRMAVGAGPTSSGRTFKSWSEVADGVLAPERYPELQIC